MPLVQVVRAGEGRKEGRKEGRRVEKGVSGMEEGREGGRRKERKEGDNEIQKRDINKNVAIKQ